MKKSLIISIGIFLIGTIAYAAPGWIYQRTMLPESNNDFDLGTSTLQWRNIYYAGNLTNVGLSDGCAKWTSGVLGSQGVPCGSGGGGSGGGSWSTSTSNVSGHLINYPNNNTDIVTVGGTATTTAPVYFDPNTLINYIKGKLGIGTTSPGTALSVNGDNYTTGRTTSKDFVSTSTVTSNIFPYASTTAATIPTAFITSIGNLNTNGFVKTGSANGTLSVDTNTYLTGNQTITLSGDVSGSGATSITTTIGNGKVTNAMLVNSTISGVALGGSLAALTATNGTLTFSGSYDGSTARTVGINLGSNNVWTASTTFQQQTNMAQASTTMLTVAGNTYLGSLNGILKGTSGLVGTASNGTDYTLITANTCGAGNHFSQVTATGVFTCSADSGGGSGGTWSTITSNVAGELINYPNNNTDILAVGGSATTSAAFYLDPNSGKGQENRAYASTTFFGFGTTSPDVAGDSWTYWRNIGSGYTRIALNDPRTGAHGTSFRYYQGSTLGADIAYNNVDGQFEFNGDSATSYETFKTGGVERLRIDNNGNVGIGTTSPGTTFSIGTSPNAITNFTTGTSTFYGTGGINLSGGCFAINGVCQAGGGGGGSGTVTQVSTDSTLTGGPITTTGTLGINLGTSNIWTASTTFQKQTNMTQASTTLLSVNGKNIPENIFKLNFELGSSTPSIGKYNMFNTATTTHRTPNVNYTTVVNDWYCKTTNGNVTAEIGNGSASSTVVATGSGVASSQTVTFTPHQDILFAAFDTGSSGANGIWCVATGYYQ